MESIKKLWKEEKNDGLMENFHYFKRKMKDNKADENKQYYSHVFVIYKKTQKNLEEEWEDINQHVAVNYQSNIDELIERSNFYICFFLEENVEIKLKETIENDTFCAKKYIFNVDNSIEEEEVLQLIEKRIFTIDRAALEMKDISDIKNPVYVDSIFLKNFRCYEGEKKFSFAALNKKAASLVVIYAPNGVGKTSLFDAIEFALKGQVDRIKEIIDRDQKDNKWKGAVYHNRAHTGEKAFVSMHLDNGEEIIRNVEGVAENRNDCKAIPVIKGADIIGKEKNLWNQLILPNYRIDNFISARNPVDQYKEWCKSTNSFEKEQKDFITTHKILVNIEKKQKELEKTIFLLKEGLKNVEADKEQVLCFQQLILEYNQLSEEKLPEFLEGDGVKKYDTLKNQALSHKYACNADCQDSCQ